MEKSTEEKMKEMMQLVHVEDVYVQALQVKHPIIDWNVHIEGQRPMFWGYDCRLWGVVWSSRNGGKTRREGLQVIPDVVKL
nr:hypothetical protein [Tanacetum cinerariifolium]